MTRSSELLERAAVLRRTFDLAFAEPRRAREARAEGVLGVRIAGDSYGLRLAQIGGGLFARQPITRLPGSAPGFLGVSALRGVVVPVYSLGALLACSAGESPRWLVLAGAGERVGLAFEHLEGHFLGATTLSRHGDGGSQRPHLEAAVTLEGRVIPLIDVPSVVQAITRAIQSDERNTDHDS